MVVLVNYTIAVICLGCNWGATKVVSQLSCNFPNGEQGTGKHCHLVSLG
jgi:hypothetical protein